MKSSTILCFFLLFFALYFFSDDTSFLGQKLRSSSVPDEESQPQGGVSSPFLHRKFKYYKSKVAVEEAKGLKAAIVSTSKPKFSRRGGIDDLDDLVYHTDYHGVTTHPSPTPKQPKP